MAPLMGGVRRGHACRLSIWTVFITPPIDVVRPLDTQIPNSGRDIFICLACVI